MKSANLRTAANMAVFCLLALVLSAGQAVASSFPYYDDPQYEVETVAPNPSSTPEPNTLLMLGSGVLGLAGIIRRKLTT